MEYKKLIRPLIIGATLALLGFLGEEGGGGGGWGGGGGGGGGGAPVQGEWVG